ncbi:MAG: cytidylate kinase-like family protein [Desulfuromonas sp.]|nr:cytidylate kinase-like family protein [Desulfuromonas sp.]
MPSGDLFPSVEQRLRAYHELSNRAKELIKKPAPPKPTITITREFGCEAFPIAEELVKMAARHTGERWMLVDRSLLDAIAREHRIPEATMQALGTKSRLFDEMFATFSKHWKRDADYYRLLCEQVVMTATAGNAVIVGLGAPIITRSMKNCFHCRLIGDHDFKVASIARRLKISKQDAEIMVLDRQKERDRIIHQLLDANEHEPLLYHAIFNNGKLKSKQIVRMIFDHTFGPPA